MVSRMVSQASSEWANFLSSSGTGPGHWPEESVGRGQVVACVLGGQWVRLVTTDWEVTHSVLLPMLLP